jgi:hypothetical protein
VNISKNGSPSFPRFSTSSACFWNAGVSSSFSRRYSPTAPSGPATRNGTRQPQSSRASRGTHAFIAVTTAAPSTKPARVPNSSQNPMNPRRLSGEYSAMNVVAPPYSPPVEKPWTMRARTSRIGDQTPTVA